MPEVKLYSDYEHSSMKMVGGASFSEAVGAVIDRYNVNDVFESGTYLGTGSTSTLAELFVKRGIFPNFTTVEVNKHFHALAVKNLAKYPFIQPTWGLSTNINASIEFIRNDSILNEHTIIQDVFIDDIVDPVSFYLSELNGVDQHKTITEKLKSLLAIASGRKQCLAFKQNVMSEYVGKHKSKRPMFLLDSSAGIGYFEFTELVRLMDGLPFILILDDIHHLKHFRSRRQIESSEDWKVVTLSETHGWLIAIHNM